MVAAARTGPAGAAAVSFLTNVTFNGASHFLRVTMNPGTAGAVGSTWTNTLNVYRSNGVEYAVSTFAQGSAAVTPTSFFGPSGVALDSSNNVYVADTGNNRILKFAQVLTIPDFLASGISSTISSWT